MNILRAGRLLQMAALAAGVALALAAAPVKAGQLIYESGDPSFGGSPLLDEFLLNLADIQNEHKPTGGGGGGGVPTINFPPITIDLGGVGDTAAGDNPALDAAQDGIVPSDTP